MSKLYYKINILRCKYGNGWRSNTLDKQSNTLYFLGVNNI